MYIQCSCCRVCHDNQDGRSNCELREEWNNKTFANANKEYKRLICQNLLVKNSPFLDLIKLEASPAAVKSSISSEIP